MAPWVKTVFLEAMPRILMMRRPHYSPRDHYEHDDNEEPFVETDYSRDFRDNIVDDFHDGKLSPLSSPFESSFKHDLEDHMEAHSSGHHEVIAGRQSSPELLAALQGVRFIAQHMKDADKDNDIVEDWKFVSMVLDRFFLWVFTLACIIGTICIIFQAPSLYDTRAPIDQTLSDIPFGKNQFVYPPRPKDVTL